MIVFICLGLVGLVLFVFSTMLSGHDQTDLGHDIDDPDTVHDSGPSLFSVFAFSFFLTGFGGVGAVLKAQGSTNVFSTLGALLAGSCLWLAAFGFMALLHKQQADSTVTAEKLIGSLGIVTIPIAEHQVGKIQCAGCSEELIVRCDEAVGVGERVRVVENSGGVYIVRKC